MCSMSVSVVLTADKIAKDCINLTETESIPNMPHTRKQVETNATFFSKNKNRNKEVFHNAVNSGNLAEAKLILHGTARAHFHLGYF